MTNQYVSKLGNDGSGTGTASSPWLTVGKGISLTSGGDILFVRSGIYSEMLYIGTKVASSTNQIIITGDSGETPVINGSGLYNVAGQGVIYIYNTPCVTIKNMEIENGTLISGIDYAGIWIYGLSSSFLTFSNLYIHDCRQSAIFQTPHWTYPATTWAKGTYINNVTALYCCQVEDPLDSQEDLSLTAVDGFEIKNCIVGHAKKEGIDVKEGCKNGSVHHNEVYDTVLGIYQDAGQSDMTNVQIYDNYVHNNSGDGIVLASENAGDVTSTRVYNNITFGNKDRSFVIQRYLNSAEISYIAEYNTFAMDLGGAVFECSGGPVNVGTIRNNIIFCSGQYLFGMFTTSGTQTTITNNQYWNPRDQTWIGQTNTLGANALTSSDPKFVNWVSADFHLTSNSPGIGQAISTSGAPADYDGVSRPQGGSYDIGAFEFYVGETSSATIIINFFPLSFVHSF